MTFSLCKKLSVVFIAAVLLLMGIVATSAEIIPGDADGDGEVTILDVTYIQRMLAEFPVDIEISEQAADVDGNGEIDIADVTFIQRWLEDMETPYPIGPQPTEAPTQRPTDEEGWGTDIFRP